VCALIVSLTLHLRALIVGLTLHLRALIVSLTLHLRVLILLSGSYRAVACAIMHMVTHAFTHTCEW
jgi:hypothetical protein